MNLDRVILPMGWVHLDMVYSARGMHLYIVILPGGAFILGCSSRGCIETWLFCHGAQLDMVILPGGAFRHGYSARKLHLDMVF
jgi:hypothetical protein